MVTNTYLWWFYSHFASRNGQERLGSFGLAAAEGVWNGPKMEDSCPILRLALLTNAHSME
jgi:hypothetical protein